jgi:uncharacterized protein YndB with AHSA1/START domain
MNKEFKITRVLDTPRDLVWKAHTEAGRLMHWWGPKGFKMLKAELDLRPGGLFHYGMEAPNGEEMWGRFIYREIIPQEKLVFVSSFSDPEGGITLPPMAAGWPLEILNTVVFEEKNGKTILTLSGCPINASEEETALYHDNHANMDQGIKGTYDQLEAYIESVQTN